MSNKSAISVIKRIIKASGPITVADFMALTVSCSLGYYQNCNDIRTDFITSPEITPIFGRLLSLKLMDEYNLRFYGKPISIIELGPGSGNMMYDVLMMIAECNPTMLKMAKIKLVEVSPTLKEIQKNRLMQFTKDISWHDSWPDPQGMPCLVIANEFFDAIPIHQYIMLEQGWHERYIACPQDELCFVAGPPFPTKTTGAPPIGSILESSPASIAIMRTIAQDIDRYGGYGIFFDYGYAKTRFSSTIRAIKKQEIVDIFTENADISAEVDFGTLMRSINCTVRTSRLRLQKSMLEMISMQYCNQKDIKYQHNIMMDIGQSFKAFELRNR